MPIVLIVGRFTFYFFSNEGTEPPHVHVDAADNSAQSWLSPVDLQSNRGFRSGERKQIQQIIEANRTFLLGKWNEFFSSQNADNA